MKAARHPIGTYTEGYDAGLRDSALHIERQYQRPKRRSTAHPWLLGYEDGYADGQLRKRPTA